MEFTQAIVLAFVQGLTEFLPVSSSAHLVITSQLFGWKDQGLVFDLGLHLGTLAAVMGYFRRDLVAYLGVLRTWHRHPLWREVWLLFVASLPAAVLGVTLIEWVDANLRHLLVIICANTLFALLLWYADRHSRLRERQVEQKHLGDISWLTAVVIGFAQALAFIPGTSRSGATLSAALLSGLSRQHAARFSFLLSIPIILGGGALALADVVGSSVRPDMALLLFAMVVAFGTAWASIGVFMRMIATFSLSIFVVYRLLLSCFLLWWLV